MCNGKFKPMKEQFMKIWDSKELEKFLQIVHNCIQLANWITMLCAKNWLRDRPPIIFFGAVSVWMLHYLTVLTKVAVPYIRNTF